MEKFSKQNERKRIERKSKEELEKEEEIEKAKEANNQQKSPFFHNFDAFLCFWCCRWLLKCSKWDDCGSERKPLWWCWIFSLSRFCLLFDSAPKVSVEEKRRVRDKQTMGEEKKLSSKREYHRQASIMIILFSFLFNWIFVSDDDRIACRRCDVRNANELTSPWIITWIETETSWAPTKWITENTVEN